MGFAVPTISRIKNSGLLDRVYNMPINRCVIPPYSFRQR
jgi:hypothetical protein